MAYASDIGLSASHSKPLTQFSIHSRIDSMSAAIGKQPQAIVFNTFCFVPQPYRRREPRQPWLPHNRLRQPLAAV
jgi:hypothetical protein